MLYTYIVPFWTSVLRVRCDAQEDWRGGGRLNGLLTESHGALQVTSLRGLYSLYRVLWIILTTTLDSMWTANYIWNNNHLNVYTFYVLCLPLITNKVSPVGSLNNIIVSKCTFHAGEQLTWNTKLANIFDVATKELYRQIHIIWIRQVLNGK